MLIQAKFLQCPTSNEQTGSIRCSPVGESMLDTVTLQLVGIGSAKDLITGDFGGDNLTDDVSVCKADNETVLWGIVLVLCLGDETLAGVVVGLTSPTTLVFGLIATIVRAILNQLRERLSKNLESAINASESPKQLATTLLMPPSSFTICSTRTVVYNLDLPF